jgi:hypothetical protein
MATAGMYQCAEMQRMTFGRGTDRPIAAQPSVQVFRVIAFIGFPCPKKMAGIALFMKFSLIALF